MSKKQVRSDKSIQNLTSKSIGEALGENVRGGRSARAPSTDSGDGKLFKE